MARGFESKDVEFQQAEAERAQKLTAKPHQTDAERTAAQARQTLVLALTNLRQQRLAATHPRHREMLDRAVHDLEQQLARTDAAP